MRRQHFYTSNMGERQNVIDTWSFKDEGTSCFVYQGAAPGPVPFYRSMAKKGGFLYTTSIAERDAATTAGETAQGIACFLMPAPDRSHIPFFRAYNPATNDHLYTSKVDEFNNAVQQLGYVDEGIAGYVVPGIGAGLVPLFRMVKTVHFYTTDAAEKDHAINKLGYTDEGIACGVEPSPNPGPQPFYRSSHPKTGAHFYTMDIAERDDAVNSRGHRGEGIVGNLFSTPQPAHSPLLRAYKKSDDDYFYTSDAGEMTNAVDHLGYKNLVTAAQVPTTATAATGPLFRLYGPQAAKQLVFTEQSQQESEWCWAATTVSIASFFDPSSPWTQCNLVNQQFKRSDCCSDPSGAKCNKPWYPEKSLKAVGHLAKHESSSTPIDGIANEISNFRPLAVAIEWFGGGGHAPVISGFDLDVAGSPILTIDDPIFGRSNIDLDQFPSKYQSGGTWTDSYKTKP